MGGALRLLAAAASPSPVGGVAGRTGLAAELRLSLLLLALAACACSCSVLPAITCAAAGTPGDVAAG